MEYQAIHCRFYHALGSNYKSHFPFQIFKKLKSGPQRSRLKIGPEYDCNRCGGRGQLFGLGRTPMDGLRFQHSGESRFTLTLPLECD